MNELLKIQEKIENDYGLPSIYVEGEGTEYGKPAEIRGKLLKYDGAQDWSISSKIGSSWYLSGCSGVRIIGMSVKSVHSEWPLFQCKLLDVTGDVDNVIWPWVKGWFPAAAGNFVIGESIQTLQSILSGKFKKKGERLHEYTTIARKINPKLGYHSIKSPKIQYSYVDVDEDFDFKVIEFPFFYLGDEHGNDGKTSVIIQIRMDRESGELSCWHTLRKLSNEKEPQPVSLPKERLVPDIGDLENTIWNEYYAPEIERYLNENPSPYQDSLRNLLSPGK